MQQTETYKLNLIETSDTFSPAALNENAQKIEAALGAAGAALSAETNARAALDSRVTVLEADKVKMFVGSYTGTGGGYGTTQTISLGLTPKVVFVLWNPYVHVVTQDAPKSGSNYTILQIVEGGFAATFDSHLSFNSRDTVYHFIALA